MKHIWWKTIAERIKEAGWNFEPVFKSKKDLLKVQQKIDTYYILKREKAIREDCLTMKKTTK